MQAEPTQGTRIRDFFLVAMVPTRVRASSFVGCLMRWRGQTKKRGRQERRSEEGERRKESEEQREGKRTQKRRNKEKTNRRSPKLQAHKL